MRLYIVRHGDAATRADGERALTALGESQARITGELLAGEGLELLLHSPKLRTSQTAGHIVDACGDLASREAMCLLPPASTVDLHQVIEQTGVETLALVSHLPWVAELVAWFTIGDMRAYTLPGFPTAGVVALDMDVVGQGTATMAWYAFPPDMVKKS